MVSRVKSPWSIEPARQSARSPSIEADRDDLAEHDDAEHDDVTMAPKVGLAARLLIVLVRVYQHTLAYLVGGHCRFHPSCSHYALEVLRTHGAFRGALRSLHRVSRCHPFSPGGYDPPPPPPDNRGRAPSRPLSSASR